ncbi:GTP-binding protein REM 1-like [Oppia nitens]|uniref:GTP-binding protein REM 1-like n=1 Tax=Oppia nitens TaxID=1686743 RepID=UPI0023DBC96F|nr:GTP-binding protein REM 1-like [Oppia nitens]
MRYTQRHNSNMSTNSTGSAPPLNRARRVSSIPNNIAKTEEKVLNKETFDYNSNNDYKNYKNQMKNNGKSENDCNFIIAKDLDHFKNEKVIRILVIGSQDSGKSSLVSQFSHFLEDQRQEYGSNQNQKYLILNFKEIESLDTCFPRSPLTVYMPEAYIVIYAVNDRESFESAKRVISEIHKWDDFDLKPVIVVANKTDLVRSRTVTKQEGRQLAIANNCKYIETSCAISHNIDDLLTGIGAQLNLKSTSKLGQPNNTGRKPNLLKRLLRKAVLNKSKSCDNLHVL